MCLAIIFIFVFKIGNFLNIKMQNENEKSEFNFKKKVILCGTYYIILMKFKLGSLIHFLNRKSGNYECLF